MHRRTAPISRSLLIIAALAASLVIAAGKSIKLYTLSYQSDLYLNTEVAANVIRLGKVFYSTVFNNMLGVHLYWLHIVESAFVVAIGPLFYMIASAITFFLATLALLALAQRSGLPSFVATIVPLAFMTSPLTLRVIDQPVYGFQYDVYSLAALPILALSIIAQWRTLSFCSLTVVALAIKEEMFIPCAILGSYFACHRCHRRRGLSLLGASVAYAMLSSAILQHYAPEAYVNPTVEVKHRLLQEHDLFNGLLAMTTQWSQNPLFETIELLAREGGWLLCALGFLALWPTAPMIIYLAVIHFIGLLEGSLFWKLPYLWISVWVFAILNLQQLKAQVGGRYLIPAVSLVLIACATHDGLNKWDTFFLENPAYRPSSAIAYFAGDASAPLRSPLPHTSYAARRAEIEEIERLRGDLFLTIMQNVTGHAVLEFQGQVHYKAGPGTNLWLVDREHPWFNYPERQHSSIGTFPVLYDSPRFLIYRSATEVSTVYKGRRKERRRPSLKSIVFTVDVPHTGNYSIQVTYTKDAPAWPGCQPVVYRVNKDPTPKACLCVPTIGQIMEEATRSLIGLEHLHVGTNRVAFEVQNGLEIYTLEATPATESLHSSSDSPAIAADLSG